MTVPGRVEAAALLLSLGPPAWLLRHSRGVAEVAGWLAMQVVIAGGPVDRARVEAAALLHDVDKTLPPADPARSLPHGEGSAAWLRRLGHAELGPAVAAHPVTRLTEEDADAWLAGAPLEDRIVAYADKRVGQRLQSMDERFASWRRRYPGSWTATEAAAAVARARRLESGVCAAAAVEPAAVRRLRWTGPALRGAHDASAGR